MTDRRDILQQLGSVVSDRLEAYAVSSYVNSPNNTHAHGINRFDENVPVTGTATSAHYLAMGLIQSRCLLVMPANAGIQCIQ